MRKLVYVDIPPRTRGAMKSMIEKATAGGLVVVPKLVLAGRLTALAHCASVSVCVSLS